MRATTASWGRPAAGSAAFGLLVGIGLLATSCAGVPATPEQRAQEERRLLAPFVAKREVGCSELLVELTGNFHEHVGQPAVDQARHSMAREVGDGYLDTVWTNTSGAADAAFVLTIGELPQVGEQGWVPGVATRFRVVNQVRLRVYQGRRPLTLQAAASGPFVLVKDGAGAPREVAQFTIADGVLRGP